MKFIPSLVLSRMLFDEEISQVMANEFPGLKYAAATLGMCSEVLGLDDEVSMDHEWGPRISIFLQDVDKVRYAEDINQIFRKKLPGKFKGVDLKWKKPGVDVQKTKETALYHIYVGTVQDTLDFYGGIRRLPLQEIDWLKVSEQHLLEFTAGVVYHDDYGELTRARDSLAYYPDNVLKFLLMREWNAVGGDWFPIGRIGPRGDEIGLHIQAAKLAQRFMRIAFMVHRTYFPYKKWFGTQFKQLPPAQVLEPMLLELLGAKSWQQVEEVIGKISAVLLDQQNKLGISPKITLRKERLGVGRHHIKYDFWGVGNRLSKGIRPPLKALIHNEVFMFDNRNHILWNEEVGKWALLLQK
jgi:hypothetical protein